jgi:hypothetical protein
LVADLRALRNHEVPRFSIVAPTVDNAQACFRLLCGIVGASTLLNSLCVGDPTADSLTIRRPSDGRMVEICVVAALRGAVTMRSRWSVGFVLDEVALFGSEPTGSVINAEELLRAGETRLVPGAQGWLISSPFGPSGLLYDLWARHFGKPGRVLVVHAPTRAMNPTFPAEQIADIRMRDPDTAAREFDGAWIDAETSFLDGALIHGATRPDPRTLAPHDVTHVAFAMDPAGLKGRNAWTLVGVESKETARGPRLRVVGAWQWIGSRVSPLSPDTVLGEIAAIVRAYATNHVATDQWSNEAIIALAARHGLRVHERRANVSDVSHLYANVATLLATGRLELPPVPEFAADLRGVRKIATSSAVRIVLTKTPDGRHCDFAPALVLAVNEAPSAAARARNETVKAGPVVLYQSPLEGLGATLEAHADPFDARWCPAGIRVERGHPGRLPRTEELADFAANYAAGKR